jgi:pyruvate dehydrogenase (quinone)
MLMGELLTARLYDLPVKIVVFNNNSLGMVKLEMMVDGLPDFGTDHRKVDFAAIAQAVGIDAIRIDEPGDVRKGLTDGLSREGPVLIDVATDPDALSMPPNITTNQVGGFALAASKKVLNGGIGQLIDMALSNLRNIPKP